MMARYQIHIYYEGHTWRSSVLDLDEKKEAKMRDYIESCIIGGEHMMIMDRDDGGTTYIPVEITCRAIIELVPVE